MTKKILFPIIILILFLQSCTTSSAPESRVEPGKSQESLQKITVVLICCYLSDAGFLIAQERGFFQEQGLEVELVRFNTFGEGMAALLSGQADIWGGGVDPGIFNGIARGEGMKVIADKGQVPSDCDYMSMAVRKEDFSKFSQIRPQELENARIAASGTQTGSYYVDKALNSIGGSLTKANTSDVPAPNRLEALLNGSVDISLLGEPWITNGIEAGKISTWMPAKDLQPSLQISAWVASPLALKNRKDVVQKFINAYLKGVRLFNQEKTVELFALIAKGTKMEPELVKRICLPDLPEDGIINFESIDEYQDWLISRGWLDSKVSSESYWDGSFLENARQILEQEAQ